MTSKEAFTSSIHENLGTLSPTELRALEAVLRRERLARDVNALSDEKAGTGQRLADGLTMTLGSWRFIIIQSIILFAWITLNVIGWISHWDPYPFILLNLALSFQAAYSAPIIMMSQNRQATKDRLAATNDYEVNVRAEIEVALIHARLDELVQDQWQKLIDIQSEQLELLRTIDRLTHKLHEVNGRIPGEERFGLGDYPEDPEG